MKKETVSINFDKRNLVHGLTYIAKTMDIYQHDLEYL